LVAVAADQFAAPILHSSSPLWATTACLLLVWRRGKIPLSPGDPALELSISIGRVAAFLAAHSMIILVALVEQHVASCFRGNDRWWNARCSVETVCLGSDNATFPSRGVEKNGHHLFS